MDNLEYLKARQEGERYVAENLAAMFGLCINNDEADRFIVALEKFIDIADSVREEAYEG